MTSSRALLRPALIGTLEWTREGLKPTNFAMVVDKPPNWLAVSLGKEDAPQPPDLASDRIKWLVGRTLLTPTAMTPQEVQEIAASVISHLVKAKQQ